MQTLQQLRSGQLKDTKKLRLSCELTEFPPEILDIANTLEILDLSGNRLSKLPDNFGLLQHLKIAFFSDNEFTEFPEVLAQCPLLEMIGFKANKISLIPEKALSPNIRWLILTNNQLTHVPTTIGKCARLQKLMLAGNLITQLPREMAGCLKLELLRISANRITELPDWLFSLPHLSWLAYAGNPCSELKQTDNNLQEIYWDELALNLPLGEGASGVITKAEWRNKATGDQSKEVAVKIFKGEVTSDGLPADEMNACMTAGMHPNLVSVLGKITGHPLHKQGLVFDLISPAFKNLGGPPDFETCTRDTYPSGTLFTVKEIIRISLSIASVAAHLHSKNISHGDLYAHNILVDETAHALLGDFGAATIYNSIDVDKAKLLERIEARAFGCLLEDLLNHIETDILYPDIVKALIELKHNCIDENVGQRPDFAAIYDYILFISNKSEGVFKAI